MAAANLRGASVRDAAGAVNPSASVFNALCIPGPTTPSLMLRMRNGPLSKVPGHLILEILEPARKRGLSNHLIQVCGFEGYYINGLTLEYMAAEDWRYIPGEWNWLFCRESPGRLREKLGRSPFRVVGGEPRRRPPKAAI